MNDNNLKYNIISCIPHINKRILEGKRIQDIQLEYLGKHLATKTVITKNKKRDISYYITEAGEQYLREHKEK